VIRSVKRFLTSATMNSYFGDEYPAAITSNGVRMPLVAERRWTRYYASKNPNMGHLVSRFMDGSAAITFQEFAPEWPTWSEKERQDFCSACVWLHKQSDYPDILRYIMQHGGPDDWSAIANSVGTRLPQGEAFDLLTRALHSTELENACNISQGISLTKHPDAERVLRAHLNALWSHASLWANDDFCNWLAYGATCCIEHLITVGAPAQDFTTQVRALSEHPCAGNRDSVRRFLPKHFPWLNNSTNETGTA
jgi:hypothetical protein